MAGQTFDVAAALKEFPESEVAAHLAEQHGINRDAYIKEGLTDADFLKEYGSQPLPGVAEAPSAADSVQNEPLATAGAGAILGGAAMAGKKTIDIAQALNKLTAPQAAAAPAPLPYDQLSSGEKWSVKTGFGSGTGETVEEQDKEYKRIKAEKEKPVGRGKVSSKVTGGSPDKILARAEAEDLERQRLAQIRAEQKMAKEAAEKAAGKVSAAEKKYHLPNKLGTALPVAGATLGYNLQDVANQAGQGDVGQAAVGVAGAAGSVAPFIKKLPPKLRAIGTGVSMLAPIFNRGVDAVEEKAAGGAVQHFEKGGLALAKKLGKVAQEAASNFPKPTKVTKASEALGQHEGKWLNVTQSDRMRSTEGDLGGPGFSKFQLERPEYAEAQAAWGVGKKPTASGIVNVNKKFKDQAIWTPMIGGETQHHSNQHVYDALKDEFVRQSGAGKLPKELQERMNARLANAPATKGMFPAEFDIGNPEHLAQYGDTFNRRGALSTVMSGEGVGGTKGRIIDYPGIMQEMTDPMTVGAPTHSLGTRLFTLNNEIEHRPDLHSAFPYILKGQDQGVAFAPVPKELGIQDFIQQFKDFKGREPGYYDLVRTTPSQQITEKYLRSLEEAGHKKGGLVATLKLKKK